MTGLPDDADRERDLDRTGSTAGAMTHAADYRGIIFCDSCPRRLDVLSA